MISQIALPADVQTAESWLVLATFLKILQVGRNPVLHFHISLSNEVSSWKWRCAVADGSRGIDHALHDQSHPQTEAPRNVTTPFRSFHSHIAVLL